VIVVDAGGSDGTMAIAARVASELTASCGVTFRLDVSARGGRGPTLAAGVDASTGPMLLFLHADTMLPDHFDSLVRGALAQEATLATAFRFRVHRELATPIVGLGTMEATVHLRSTVVQLPFGDQAMAITRQRFDAVGGFDRRAPIMEDFELVQRLRRQRAVGRIVTLGAAAECSGRRWAVMGVARANLLNQAIMVAYVYGGCGPAEIYELYYKSNGPRDMATRALNTTRPGRALAAALKATGVL